MTNKKGYFLIEALLAIVIFSVLLVSLFSMVGFLQRRAVRSTFETDAGLLLQDGVEIAHAALISNWMKYADDTYYPAFNVDTNSWELIPGEETELEAKFTRKIVLSRVCRDTNTGEKIEYSGSCPGEIDPVTREITTTVSWEEQGDIKEVEAKLLVLNTN